MKVYVIKSKQTKEYQTVVIDFIPDIRQSDIFIDYEVALAYCPSDCEVVECELMEKTELTDHTKQVRKEFCEEMRTFAYDTFKEFGCFDETDLEHILDQIQGRNKK